MTNSNQSSHNPPHYHIPVAAQQSKQAMNDASPRVPQIDFKIMEKGIRKLLSGLNLNKAAGLDEHQQRVLKELTDVLAILLTLIYNVSKIQLKMPRD